MSFSKIAQRFTELLKKARELAGSRLHFSEKSMRAAGPSLPGHIDLSMKHRGCKRYRCSDHMFSRIGHHWLVRNGNSLTDRR